MLDTILLLVNQTVVMFLLAAAGYALYRGGKIGPQGSRTVGNLLIYASLPCVIVKGFLTERTAEKLAGLGIAAVCAAAALGLAMLISRRVFREDGIGAFAGAFSNPGFFGVPLITAVLGGGAVFYATPFIAMLNMLQWTWGVGLLTGTAGKLTAKKIITAPFMVAILIGLFLFLTGLPLPEQVTSAVGYVAGLNTPLAMFSVGIYLAQTDLKAMFRKRALYRVSAVRLLAVPLLTLLLLTAVPGSFSDMKYAVLICAACPVGSNIAVYADLYDRDRAYAAETVVISTLLSILTIPCAAALASLLWGL